MRIDVHGNPQMVLHTNNDNNNSVDEAKKKRVENLPVVFSFERSG
jgi:hypothetical protein